MDLGSVLADVARVGPYFAVSTSAGASRATVREVLDGPLLDARIAHVARALNCEDRVAASVAHQGFAAMLVSAPLAVVAVHGAVPDWTPETLFWTPPPDGAWELSVDPGRVGLREVDHPSAAREIIGEIVVEGVLAPLAAAVHRRVSVPAAALRGNAASAVVTALRLVGGSRPHVRSRAAALARDLVPDGAGEWTAGGFRRRSCCLYWKVPAGGLCGDCVLGPVVSPGGRRRSSR